MNRCATTTTTTTTTPSEFVWSPSNHHFVRASKYLTFNSSVQELFMIRDMADGATMVWLPNEVMFEICRALFRLHYLESSIVNDVV